jgi:flagellar FliL protein
VAKDKKDKKDKAPKESGGKGMLVPALVVAVAVLGAGYLMSSRKASAHPAGAAGAAGAAATTTTTRTSPVDEGEVVKLDSITLNLADNRYLKVGIALQLAKGVAADKMTTHAPLALDEAIALLGDLTYAQLSAPGGRAQAKAELTDRVKKRFGGKVTDVYFTEFVMQ